MIPGVIFSRKSIVTTAQRGHFFAELTWLEIGSALEHHVLEHMRHARRAILLINAARAIPDHVRNGRRTPIFLHDDAHAIS